MSEKLSFIIPRGPLVDQKGYVSRTGVQFFLGLFNRTGGEEGVDAAALKEIVRLLAVDLDLAEFEIDELQAAVELVAAMAAGNQQLLAALDTVVGSLLARQSDTERALKKLETVCLSNLARS